MKALLKNPLFLIGLFIRLVLLFSPSAGVMSDYFIPFIDFGAKNPFESPWNQLPPEYFPYGVVLYAILLFPKLILYSLFGDATLGLSALSFFLTKLPLLGFDLLFLKLFLKITEKRINHLMFFYWLNPVVIYISFIHGQLDIIPMYFAFLAIYFTGNNKPVCAGLVSALAVLSKFHTIIIVPIVLAYFWNNYFISSSLSKIRNYLLSFVLPLLIGLLPLILGNKLQYNSLGSPEALRIFSLSVNFSDKVTVYIGIMIVLAILGRLILSTKMTTEGLIYSCALLFGSLLAVTHSMPGWYFWVLPFFALFFITYNFAPRILYISFIALYFLTFSVVFPESLSTNLIHGISFSLLQLVTITILVFIYLMALKNQAPLQRRLRPLSIGIAGNSGAGKNLISSSLMNIFGPKSTQVIEGDDYHKWERGNVKWQDYTHLHPRANHLSHLKEHFHNLVHGKLIFQKHYDHSSGQFTEPRPLAPTKTMIVQGLHTLYLRSLRDLYDLKIYISPDESLRTAWKIKRDCGERGYSLEKVLTSLKSREKDTVVYVQPQRDVADIVIEYIPTEELVPEKVLSMTKISFKMKLILWNDNILEDLIESLSQIKTLSVELVDEEDINRVGILIHGDISTEQVAAIANSSIAHQRAVTRSRTEPLWESGYIGIIQLFILKILSERV